MCPHHPQAMGPASAAEDLWRSNGDPWRIGPPTPTQGSSERPSAQPGPYLCSSTGLVTPTGRQPGDKESLAGSAPGHPIDPLSTSSSGDCSANSWHCSCPEQSAGCGFTALFLIHADQRKKISSPRLGERRCCKQPVPATRKKSGWETPGPLPGGAQPRALQRPAGPFTNSRGEIFPAEFSSP